MGLVCHGKSNRRLLFRFSQILFCAGRKLALDEVAYAEEQSFHSHANCYDYIPAYGLEKLSDNTSDDYRCERNLRE